MKRVPAGDLAALLFLLTIVGLILFGEALAPYPPTEFHPLHSLEGPSRAFLFGTDEFGRDIFSRVISGTRPTLLVAVGAAIVGVLLGAVTGLVAGYFGGVVDEAVMRVMDALMSFPGLILSMLVVVMLGPHPINVITALALVFWPRSARLIRSVVTEVARRAFVQAARSRGESRLFILLRELLPNVWSIVTIDLSLRVTSGILMAAALAFLGIGATPPTPAWGLMVRDGQPFLQIAPWLVIFPCLAVSLTAIGTVLLGERLRKRLALPGGDRGR
ncbi:ABC transporter permease [Humitalea sp. 24SJ18S-53]|uniref:ABC transporter permease n=1 Tax=Humitalea sp. 24SJ18S-53 TaxID=3422307 RepID=UPI003D6665A3